MVRIMSQKYCKEKRENRLRKRVIVETLELNTAMQDGVYTIKVAHSLTIGTPAHHNNTQYTHRTINSNIIHT
jgi:hypothetical protein